MSLKLMPCLTKNDALATEYSTRCKPFHKPVAGNLLVCQGFVVIYCIWPKRTSAITRPTKTTTRSIIQRRQIKPRCNYCMSIEICD